MRRFGMSLLIIILVGIPLVFVVLSRWDDISHSITMLSISKRKSGSNFTFINKVPGYNARMLDTAYLDYIAGKLTIFAPNGVIDVAANSGDRKVTTRYTVTTMRIELVPKLDRYIVGTSGNEFFAAYGIYSVEGDTLVVKIALNFEDSKLSASTHAEEEVFLDVLYQVLYFAHGVTYGVDFTEGFDKNQKDMKEFLRTNIFAWPIVIEKP